MKKFKQNEIKELLTVLVHDEFRKVEKYHKKFSSSDIHNHTSKLANLLYDLGASTEVIIKKKGNKNE
jgi:hypothetical protein|tara:strand:+ start:1791 stop:1991 length:201 start_codon:yes stop_codon:yes gene_type:complete